MAAREPAIPSCPPVDDQTATRATRLASVAIDFAGSSPQSPLGVNSTLVYTNVWATYTMKCLAAPGLPNNEGTFAPIASTAPEGSFLNPRWPAPVKMKPSSGHDIKTINPSRFQNWTPRNIPLPEVV